MRKFILPTMLLFVAACPYIAAYVATGEFYNDNESTNSEKSQQTDGGTTTTSIDSSTSNNQNDMSTTHVCCSNRVLCFYEDGQCCAVCGVKCN